MNGEISEHTVNTRKDLANAIIHGIVNAQVNNQTKIYTCEISIPNPPHKDNNFILNFTDTKICITPKEDIQSNNSATNTILDLGPDFDFITLRKTLCDKMNRDNPFITRKGVTSVLAGTAAGCVVSAGVGTGLNLLVAAALNCLGISTTTTAATAATGTIVGGVAFPFGFLVGSVVGQCVANSTISCCPKQTFHYTQSPESETFYGENTQEQEHAPLVSASTSTHYQSTNQTDLYKSQREQLLG